MPAEGAQGGESRRDLEWGLNLLPDVPANQVAELAAWAEHAGFDRCWVYDEGLATRELYVTLTAIALATERIAFGPGITNPYTRHPSVMASAIATLYELSGGRAFIGIGAGGSLTLNPVGVVRERPATTIRETIEICRALGRGEVVDYDGEVITLRQARMDYAAADIAIWVAGRGPRVLATGAELADGVSLDHIHRDFLAAQVARVHQGARRAENHLDLAYSATLVTNEAELERARQHMTYRLVDSPPAVKDTIGMGERDSDAIRAALAGGLDAAARLVKDEWVFPFVIHGSPTECAAIIDELWARHGFREFTVPVPDLDFAEATLETATAVMGAAGHHRDFLP